MAEWKKGEFCWTEVAVSDLEKAKGFYSKVLGWEYDEVPMPNDSGTSYLMWKVKGVQSGGMFELADEQKKMNIPSHWLNYFHTDSTDDFVSNAKKGGCQVTVPPMDVGDMGRMCIMADPAGASFACWQPGKNQKDMAPRFSQGKVAWRELMTTDVEKAGKFYSTILGWDIESADMGEFTYHSFKLGDSYEAGMLQITPDMGGMPSNWVTYINVDDCDEAVGRIEANGGKALHEIRDVPQVGRFCTVMDNVGATFAVITMPRES